MSATNDHALKLRTDRINVVTPIASSETELAVEQIAAFADEARPEHLPSEIRKLFKRNILDSLGCALGALPGKPFARLRRQFGGFRAEGPSTLMAAVLLPLDQAALYNTGLVRYVDLLDSYMSAGGLCHPADNFGGVLAVAESVGASGEDFMLSPRRCLRNRFPFHSCGACHG